MKIEKSLTNPFSFPTTHDTFKYGDCVRDTNGKNGTVVGWYSTHLTKEGYVVESSADVGSVQFYSVKSLVLMGLEKEKTIDPTDVDAVMKNMYPDWRYRWCKAGACACMGCANVSGQAKFTEQEWKEWVDNNPREKYLT